MKNNKKQSLVNFALLFTGLFMVNVIWAQDEDNLNTDVIVNGDLLLQIKDSNKFDSWPETYESIIEMPTITYSLIPNKLETDYKPDTIKAAKINIEEKLKKLYRGYVKGGYGMFNSPLLELRFMDGRSRDGAFNIFAKHNSSNGSTAVADSINDSFRNNQFSLWGKRFIGKYALEGYFDWKNEEYNFFGFYPENFPDANTERIGRTTNDFGAGLELKSYFRDTTKLNYVANFDFNAFADNYKSTLNELNFNVFGDKEVEGNLFSAGLKVEYDQYDYVDRVTEKEQGFDNVLVQIEPMASTTKGKLTANVGARFVFNSYRTDDSDPFANFYPMANVQYNLFNNMFIPYAGIKGELTQNSYRSMVEVNPFVSTSPLLRNTNNKFEFYGGIKGTLTPNSSFNARVSHRKMENFIFWANDSLTSPGSMFLAEYGDLSITEVMGELTINTSDKLDMFVKGQYFIYGNGSLETNSAFYQPSINVSMIGRYTIEDKIIIEAELYAMDKRTAKSYVPIPGVEPNSQGFYVADLKGFADFNLHLEYRYTKRLSGFVKVNNLLGARYMRYNNYPAQRLAAMLGATYSF